MELQKTKKIVIFTGLTNDEAVIKMHDWLNSNCIDHSVSIKDKKIFLKNTTLIFIKGSKYEGLKADGCVCLKREISDYITNGKNILENTTLEDYILEHENKLLYIDIDKEIKKREGWL